MPLFWGTSYGKSNGDSLKALKLCLDSREGERERGREGERERGIEGERERGSVSGTGKGCCVRFLNDVMN